jgi:hypothetical protein
MGGKCLCAHTKKTKSVAQKGCKRWKLRGEDAET